jgi:hypothetical protein
MSKLTKEQRDKLPEGDFGDPKRRLFPIVDQDDVDSAASLLGKAQNPDAVKARIISIAKRKKLSIPDAWKSDSAKHSLASFALGDASEDGDYVIRTGKVFEAGDYPDKAFAITPEEMLLAVEGFSPVPVDLEHVPTPLDGKLGELRSVEVGPDGWSLTGTVALPRWLDAALEGSERKVSATWDRATKTLQGLALVRNPRVTDAALMAAFAVDEVANGTVKVDDLATWFVSFAKHDTPEGQYVMQELHNVAARYGAVCKSGNAQMASAHEASALQKIHDMAADHGAKCASAKAGTPSPYRTGLFSRKEGSPVSNAWDWLRSKLEGEPAPEEATTAGTQSTATMSATQTAEFESLKKRQAELEAENRRIRQERIRDLAVSFADTQIREQRAVPAERESIIADYVQRATDDSLYGTVTFGEGEQAKKTSRVEQLAAMFAARQQHGLTREQLEAAGLSVLMNRSETDRADKPSSKEKIDEMIAMTPLGQAHLSARNGKN